MHYLLVVVYHAGGVRAFYLEVGRLLHKLVRYRLSKLRPAKLGRRLGEDLLQVGILLRGGAQINGL